MKKINYLILMTVIFVGFKNQSKNQSKTINTNYKTKEIDKTVDKKSERNEVTKSVGPLRKKTQARKIRKT